MAILSLILIALGGLIVNERFGNGVSAYFLTVQAIFFFAGMVMLLQTDSILLLSLSAILGVAGFIYLLTKQPRRFTKPLLPGLH